MLYVGLDLSRKRLDWQALRPDGERAAIGAVPPDRDGLSKLVRRLGDGEEVLAVIESMSGARFVHDELELQGWDVRIADALKARGIAPLACNTDTIDTWVLAELARLELVPEIWPPPPGRRRALRPDGEEARRHVSRRGVRVPLVRSEKRSKTFARLSMEPLSFCVSGSSCRRLIFRAREQKATGCHGGEGEDSQAAVSA